MSKHTYADSALKSWTKDELIHQIRILERNLAVKQELVNNQAKLLETWAPVVRCKDCEHWGTRKCTPNSGLNQLQRRARTLTAYAP